MTVVSMLSCSGAPGVTTVAVATAAALTDTDVYEPVMVELATTGGVVASQYDLPTEPGLTSLALALGGETPELLAHAQELPGGLPVVFAPQSGSKTRKLLEARAAKLADYFQQTPAAVIADCGRVASDTTLLPVLEQSSLIGLVVRPSRENFHLAASTAAELKELSDAPLPIGWVLVGPCPWSHDEITSQYGLPILSLIAHDQPGAEAVAGLRRFRRHSPLARSAQSFADDIAKHLRIASADAPLGYLNRTQSENDTESATETEPATETEVESVGSMQEASVQ